MRRERSPSEDRGRAPGPVWDNPGSQLPGTGVVSCNFVHAAVAKRTI